MTQSPSEDRNIVGLDGPKYDLPDHCVVCGTVDQLQRHHAWRKSDVIGDRWWVLVPNEKVVIGNCVKLCHACHLQVTDNYARLKFAHNRFYWNNMQDVRQPIKWQPPCYRIDDELLYGVAVGLRTFVPAEEDAIDNLLPPSYEERIDPLHGTRDHDPNFCPACKRKLPKQKDEKLEEKKVRKTWSVAVPVERHEDGADVLDTLIEEARREMFDAGLQYGESSAAKYHVMSTALALFVQNAQRIMADD